MATLSVVVLTLNEERLIERCIASVPFADEVVVVDSGSTDRTRELAAAAGARVIEQEWLGWSPQRTRGIDAAGSDWVFCLEADEVVSGPLAASIQRVLAEDPDPGHGYALDRRDDFLGALMPNEARARNRNSFVRLFNRTRSHYDPTDVVHERVIVPGSTIPIDGTLIHWRGASLGEMVATLNRYAGVEAAALDEQGRRARPADLVVRPVARFAWCFLWKRGYGQSVRGFLWAATRSAAEFLRYARLWELQHEEARLADPPDHVVDGSSRASSR